MINGIWSNKYVCELGIFEHLDECKTLLSNWQEIKANAGSNTQAALTARSTLDRELADLYIILMKYFSFDGMQKCLAERTNRFKEKARENE